MPRKKLTLAGQSFEMKIHRGKLKLEVHDKGAPSLIPYLTLTEKQWFKLYEWLHGHAEDL